MMLKFRNGKEVNTAMNLWLQSRTPIYLDIKAINRTNEIQTPTGYENVTNLYAKSLESELESNTQFRNYLLTGNITENEASQQSLSDAFRYEIESFKAFKSASNATNN